MKLSAFDFAIDIEKQIENADPLSFRVRTGRMGTILEELYPLSRLALALKQPGLEIEIEAYEKSLPIDAHIWVSGFRQEHFAVEVTYANYGGAEALRDELLVQDGFSPCAGSIKRNKKTKKIEATMEAEDFFEPITKLARSIVERVAAKNAKTYPEGCVLLVAFEDTRLIGMGWWSILFAKLNEFGGIKNTNFRKIYLFNRLSNELQQWTSPASC